MLHTKPQGHWPFGSGEKDFWRVFTIYGHGGHLGHVTQTPRTNFCSPIPLRLYMKFNFDRPNGFGEDLWKWWTTDGRRWIDDDGRMTDHGYTISSPISSSELIMSIINVGEIKNCDYSRSCLFFDHLYYHYHYNAPDIHSRPRKVPAKIWWHESPVRIFWQWKLCKLLYSGKWALFLHFCQVFLNNLYSSSVEKTHLKLTN